MPIAVIGDVMVDCYVTGRVSRISPEAPVPVVQVTGERSAPGGAANVALNLAALGCSASLVGLTGDDEAGDLLRDLLADTVAVNPGGLIRDNSRITTRKTRIVGEHQQIVRLDHEVVSAELRPEIETSLIEAAIKAIENAALVIISDYGKGACSDQLLRQSITTARRLDIPVLVDPKRTDFSAYRGATILTPNRRELTAATGLECESDEEADRAAAAAQAISGAAILLTRSEKGLSFLDHGRPVIHLPTAARQVFDVSGAGDTVIAALGAALAAKLPLPVALDQANRAAGLAVGKAGTAVITRREMTASETHRQAAAAVLSSSQLVDQRRAWAAEGLTVGFTNGCFDLLHPGHVALLDRAAAECDRLIVGLNSDASVRRLKGSDRPIQDERSRALMLTKLRSVAAVSVFDEDTPLTLIEAVEPDLLVKGADYREDQIVGAATVKSRGGRLLLVPLVADQSTTRLAGAGLDASLSTATVSSDTS